MTRRQLRDSALFAGDALYDGTLERPSGPPLEGPLSKRSEKGLIKSMKKRYFRLDPEKLHLIYYKNQKEAYGGKMRCGAAARLSYHPCGRLCVPALV